MTIEPWFIGAVVLSLLGYGVYIVGLSRHLVEPNRASWLIWSAATGVEAATYAAVNPGAPQAWIFILSALCCIIVTAAMWAPVALAHADPGGGRVHDRGAGIDRAVAGVPRGVLGAHARRRRGAGQLLADLAERVGRPRARTIAGVGAVDAR